MNAIQTTTPIVQHSDAVREQKHSRHFYSGGRDLFQTKSPSVKLVGSPNAVAAHRQRVAVKQQQAQIDAQDTAFIEGLFETGIPSDSWTD